MRPCPITTSNNLTQQAPLNTTGRNRQPSAKLPASGNTHDRNHHKKRANVRIAMLNVNGVTAPTHKIDLIDKWSSINKTMKEEKIAILTLQETHLDNLRLKRIENCFGKSLSIYNLDMPENPRGSGGIAIVLNKALIDSEEFETHILIKGQAILTNIKWANTGRLTIMNVYAPTDRS
jgi:exonuclease III